MKVETAMLAADAEVPRRRLALLARRVLRGEKGDLNVTIVFADDTYLRRLNREYRAVDRTTDVLSFNIPGVPPVARPCGELYISLPQAARQARRFHVTLGTELERLVVHGVLHLLGHDHQKPSEAQHMRAREAVYLGPAPS